MPMLILFHHIYADNMIQFLIFFILITLVTSFAIVSFYEITRSYIVIQPDGKETIGGYLLKHWSWYWEYVTETKRIYYCNELLKHKLSELKRLLPEIGNKFNISDFNEYWLIKQGEMISADEISKIKAILMCELDYNGTVKWMPFLREDIYLFPSWIRKPLSSCVRCMSSFFGSIIWLSVNYLYKPFWWTNHNIFAFIFFWIIFCITLAKSNEFIYKKTYV